MLERVKSHWLGAESLRATYGSANSWMERLPPLLEIEPKALSFFSILKASSCIAMSLSRLPPGNSRGYALCSEPRIFRHKALEQKKMRRHGLRVLLTHDCTDN